MLMRVSSRQRYLLIWGFSAALLVVLLASNLVLYERARSHLDNELGERLQAIAVTLALAVGRLPPAESEGEPPPDPRLPFLSRARTENLLSNIVLLSPEGRTVIDLAEYSRPGEMNPFIDMDYSAVVLAQSGLPANTALYRSGNVFLKSAYAPVFSDGGDVEAIVGVEAGAGFFAVLRGLGGFILVVDIAAALAVAVLAFFFYRQSRALDRAQAAILRSENLATMGRMVAGIAHEIRNPLSIIKTSAERLSRKYNAEDETFSYISEEVDELDRILTGYLNFAGAKPSDFADVPLKKVLRRCVMILESELAARAIRVVQDLPDSEIAVRGDDKRLQQAVLNVLINSCQAIDRGGTIVVSLEAADKSAVIRVRDDGGGIPEKDLKEVVKPFFTTKQHGSGLGLSIVDKIITEHGGTLEIASRPGEETEVSIAIPRSGTA